MAALYESEPALLLHLGLAGRDALAAHEHGDDERRADAIAEIDGVTDRLAERGLCRPRGDTSMLSAERARLGYRGGMA